MPEGTRHGSRALTELLGVWLLQQVTEVPGVERADLPGSINAFIADYVARSSECERDRVASVERCAKNALASLCNYESC